MKWSKLPQEYKDLRKGFDDDDDGTNEINERFWWSVTEEGLLFWQQCHLAKTINELPILNK
jgi:hypothetical protein